MTFGIGQAVKEMQRGNKVARAGWNGNNMFLFLVAGWRFQVNRPPLLGIYPEGTTIDYRPHVDMKTADGEIVPWVCSQSDLLATDWSIVGEAKGETFLDCLKAEEKELRERYTKLGEFFGSEARQNLDKRQRILLGDQHVAMGRYLRILVERLRILEPAEDIGEARTIGNADIDRDGAPDFSKD